MNWKVTKEEFEVIAAIATRANAELNLDYRSTMMDLNACHANGNPLKLKELQEADMGTFGHDVLGIRRYIDRNTGKLTDFFTPRLSKNDFTPTNESDLEQARRTRTV